MQPQENKMIDRVNQDLKEAMKARDKDRMNALRYLKSVLLENKTAKDPKPELDVIISYSKKLKDSLESYPEGSEAVAKIQTELEHLKPYLPQPMAENDVSELIKNIAGSLENPNMGMLMKELSPQIKGKFDGKKASQMVKDYLENS
jgi:uncharacterized protein